MTASPARDLFGDPRVVLHDVRGVDDEEEVIAFEAIDQEVVNERALRCQEPRVLRLSRLEPRRVVAGDPLHRGQRVFAGEFELAHVADVEQAGARANGHVFVGDAGVFERHVPSAKGNHLGARRAVASVERRLLEGRGGLVHRRQEWSGDGGQWQWSMAGDRNR